ncbi:MAG: hypothetical protein GIW95_05705 [Candidatus Eremiobacteraeota bacterium]|nr:hypothetical protein [Candidatus Eremiobacteraeota bacterium]
MTLVAAYAAAIVAYAAISRLAQLPESTLWDDTLRTAIRFLLLMAVTIAWLIPGMRSDADAVTKTASVVFALSLGIYAALKITGFANPDFPEQYVTAHARDILRTRFAL